MKLSDNAIVIADCLSVSGVAAASGVGIVRVISLINVRAIICVTFEQVHEGQGLCSFH